MLVNVVNSASFTNNTKYKTEQKTTANEMVTTKRIERIKMNNMAKQSRVKRKITSLSNNCYTNPDLEICKSYWSFLDDVEMVLDKQEIRYHKHNMSDISSVTENDRWDVI